MKPLSFSDAAQLLCIARNPQGEHVQELVNNMTNKEAKQVAQELLARVAEEGNSVVIKRGQPCPRVVFVWADDWVATYIDGRKALEGHSINHHTLLNKLGIEYVSLPVDQKWLEEEQGCEFSEHLRDIQIGSD